MAMHMMCLKVKPKEGTIEAVWIAVPKVTATLDTKKRTQNTQLVCYPSLGGRDGRKSIKIVMTNEGINTIKQTVNTRSHEAPIPYMRATYGGFDLPPALLPSAITSGGSSFGLSLFLRRRSPHWPIY